MRTVRLFVLFIITWASAPYARSATPAPPPDTLTAQQCRAMAVNNSPLQQKKLYAESIAALQIRNLQSNNLPRISVGAQATWQSDVFGFPGDNPALQAPDVPRDQYKLSLDVAQRIWDGGSDRYLRQQRELERDLAGAQVDVDAYQLREVVTDLYFRALLLRENENILLASLDDLRRRLVQVEASVAGGVALRSAADQVRIQILKTEQQVAATQADRQAMMDILARWLGREQTDFVLAPPQWSDESLRPELRPELRLFALQERNYQLQKDRLQLQLQPRIEAFAQTGAGRPNPFNFFETGFEPFLLVGLRATWTPLDWGNRRREAQTLDLQVKNTQAQRLAFEQRLEANTRKEFWDMNVKYKEQLAQDDAIVSLQEDIVRRAEAQVNNGVMTETDYLGQLDLLTQTRLSKKLHELQSAQAREMLVAKLGK